MPNIIRNAGRTLADYLTGLPTRKELLFLEEVEMRKLWPSNSDEHPSAIEDLKKISAVCKKYRNYHTALQTGLTLLTSTEIIDYFEDKNNYNLLRAGIASLFKLFLYYAGRKDIAVVRSFNEEIKSNLNSQMDFEGEEWKEGTNYPLSDEYL